jgi:hypothetical protein
MKEIVSLLMTTACLAVAGLGIYFFSSNSDETEVSLIKSNKKRSGGKKTIELEDKFESYNNDYSEKNDSNENYEMEDKDDDDDSDYVIKSKQKSSNKTKTKKNKQSSSASRKRYYY